MIARLAGPSRLWRRPALSGITLRRDGMSLLRAREASTFWQRLRGLHALPPLGPDDALLIRPCRAVQTFGMAVTIDVAFLGARGEILRLDTLAPASVAFCPRARSVLEMAHGTARRLGLEPGQWLVRSMEDRA